MRADAPLPLRQPREFGLDELFFSVTDKRGVILAGNPVFVRVSGYAEADLVGAPHNIIRHPDMPRAVFQLLWDTLRAGEPIAALVKNLAADGRFYWVLALAAPSDEGFISVRVKPCSPLLAAIEKVYAEMRALEHAEAARGGDVRAQIMASTAHLAGALGSLGFGSYREFMLNALLVTELAARDATLAVRRPASRPLTTTSEDPSVGHHISEAWTHARAAAESLREIQGGLDQLRARNQDASRTLLGMSDAMSIAAVNLSIRAANLGDLGRSAGVIATYFEEAAAHIRVAVDRVAARFQSTSDRVGVVVFNVAWARVLCEMGQQCLEELAAEPPDAPRERRVGHVRNVVRVHRTFAHTVQRALGALEALHTDTLALEAVAGDLDRRVIGLQLAQVGGRVVAAHVPPGADLESIFTELRGQIDQTRGILDGLRGANLRTDRLTGLGPAVHAVLNRARDQFGEDDERLRVDVAESTPGP